MTLYYEICYHNACGFYCLLLLTPVCKFWRLLLSDEEDLSGWKRHQDLSMFWLYFCVVMNISRSVYSVSSWRILSLKNYERWNSTFLRKSRLLDSWRFIDSREWKRKKNFHIFLLFPFLCDLWSSTDPIKYIAYQKHNIFPTTFVIVCFSIRFLFLIFNLTTSQWQK